MFRSLKDTIEYANYTMAFLDEAITHYDAPYFKWWESIIIWCLAFIQKLQNPNIDKPSRAEIDNMCERFWWESHKEDQA